MKRSNILIAIACLVLPGLLTTFWFYSGFPVTNSVKMPEFSAIDIPTPPLSTAIPLKIPPENPKTTILFDMSHGNMVSMSEIDPFIRAIESMGGAIEVTSQDFDLKTSLKTVNAFISLAPLQNYSSFEISTITSFVKRGGFLIIATDPTRNLMASDSLTMSISLSGVDIANRLLEPFDTSISDDYLYDMVSNEGNYRNVILTDFDRNELMKNVSKLVIYGGHSVKTNEYPLASCSDSTYSSATDMAGEFSPFALVKYGDGNVLVLGDLSLLTTQYVQSADNQVFVYNLAGFVTGTSREKTLEDFPAIFNDPVVLVPDNEMELKGDLLSIVAKLEKVIGTEPGELSVSRDNTSAPNRVLLTTFNPGDEAGEILAGLGIDLSPQPLHTATVTPTAGQNEESGSGMIDTELIQPTEYVDSRDEEEIEPVPVLIGIPGLSTVSTDGLGLVGLVRDENQTTLIIVTSSSENLANFITDLTINGLSGCLVKDNLAACDIFSIDLEPKG